MILRDWRDLPASALAPLRDAEIARWRADLSWDARGAWREVELARAAGILPGLVAERDGRIVGWTFYLPHESSLQVGAFAAVDAGVTHAMVDELLISPEADAAADVLVFALDAAPGLSAALARRGFATEEYRYLRRAIERPGGAADGALPGARGWQPRDRGPLRRLLARAYPRGQAARPFARGGSDAEWAAYVEQLVATGGCGALIPELSTLVPSHAPDGLDAALMVTRIGDTTAHLAQCVVDPSAWGRGLGGAALRRTLARLGEAGYTAMTLLVAASNARAARLYERLGFVETARFVSAVRDQPRRSSSVAFEAGGVSTLR